MTMWCTARSAMGSTLPLSIHRKARCRPTTILSTTLELVPIRRVKSPTMPASALRELPIAELRDQEPPSGSITRCMIVDRAAEGIPAHSMQGPGHLLFDFATILSSPKPERIILSLPEMSLEFPEATICDLAQVEGPRAPQRT